MTALHLDTSSDLVITIDDDAGELYFTAQISGDGTGRWQCEYRFVRPGGKAETYRANITRRRSAELLARHLLAQHRRGDLELLPEIE